VQTSGDGRGGSTGIIELTALQGRANMASAASDDKAKLRGTTLANTDLGEKRTCPECGGKFYDLGKRPATCPKCRTVFDPATDAVKPKRTREKPRPEPEDEDEIEDEELDESAAEDEEIDTEEEDVDLVDEDVVDPEEEADVEPRPATSKKYVDPDVDPEEDIGDDEDDLTVIDEDEDFDEEDIELEGDEDEEEL